MHGAKPRLEAACLLLNLHELPLQCSEGEGGSVDTSLSGPGAHLAGCYPAEHSVTLIWSASRWFEPAWRLTLAVDELSTARSLNPSGMSPFVLRLLQPAVADRAFVARMLDREHFDRTYRPRP